MIKDKLSVIIPSRVDQYLQRTIDDLLEKAEGEIEIIIICDGYWPDPITKDDPRVILLHQGLIHDNFGMRKAINDGIRLSKGEYIMKCDEHTMWDKGFDTKLKADCKDDWVVIPRRKRLDAENWTIINDGRPDIDYMYISWPYERPYDRTCGLYGAEWKRPERNNILIDDTMSWQGSAWFMKRSYWDKLFPEGLDEINYGAFNHEAQEIGNTVWLSGGRLVVNKKTWYAHLHKGKGGKGYGFSNAQYRKLMTDKEKARRYAIDYWLTTKDFKYDWKWLMDKFSPVPTWPENWQEQLKIDEKNDWRYHQDKQPSDWVKI